MHAKAKLAAPACRRWKQLRQRAVLQIRNPCHCRMREPPTKETCRFDDDIDPGASKRRCGAAIQTKPECRGQPWLSIERVRSNDLDTRYCGKLRELTLLGPVPGKDNRNEFAGQKPGKRRKQIALIIVAAGPKPSRNVTEREPQWAGRHEACPLNQAT
ncbi:hypothetical protein QA635_15475 [Bradyrhizobium brasilense]|uniref:hypothetical protein n=1 Tax=Bradyrhizobium brasilense TaxID=1419277 RepID=UPI0024B16071|nr:hypothetical protein [Bradyrhizobium australafricanum]WFU35729.1 hypothetical protein QA635_15475 [Bradyrhizobium australafricanum]